MIEVNYTFIEKQCLNCCFSVLTKAETGCPLLETLMHVSKGPHWFVITFACGCILAGSIALVEAIRDGRRQLTQMAADGLVYKEILKYSQLPIVSVSNFNILQRYSSLHFIDSAQSSV